MNWPSAHAHQLGRSIPAPDGGDCWPGMSAVGAALTNDERDDDSMIAVRVAAARSRTCQHDRTAESRPVS